jgi:hypothetical protein
MREFVESLNARGVDYAIVGGFAVAYHGYPRYTGDIDFFVRQDRRNLTKVLEVLAAFGFPLSMKVTALLKPDVMVKIGEPPNRIDVLTSIDGVTFAAVWAGRVAGKLDGLPVAFIGRDELLANKRAANRLKDQADVAELEARPPRRRRLKKAAGRRSPR